MSIVATVRTWDGVKLYLDNRGNVTTRDPKPLIKHYSRFTFERLSQFTLAQIVALATLPVASEATQTTKVGNISFLRL
jgi:hypothetical protein